MRGRCECGHIKFRVKGDVEDYSHCHCSQCRRLHGAAFASFAGVKQSNVNWFCAQDEPRRYTSSPGHERWFCGHCGSSLAVTMSNEPAAIYLALGTFEGNPELPAGYHIFVGSKAAWYPITDGLPQFVEEPE